MTIIWNINNLGFNRTNDLKTIVKYTLYNIELLQFLDNNMVYFNDVNKKMSMFGKFGKDENIIKWFYPNEEVWVNDNYWKQLTEI